MSEVVIFQKNKESSRQEPVRFVDNPWSNRVLGAAMVITVLAGIAMDWHLSHGYVAYWRADAPSVNGAKASSQTFGVTHEPVAAFANYRRPLSRIMNEWDFDRDGVPTQFPPLDVMLRSTLQCPHPGVLKIESPNTVEIWVDGEPYDNTPISAGNHSLRLHWRAAPFKKKAKHWNRPKALALRPLWVGTQGRQSVPRGWLHAAPTWRTRIATWSTVGLTLVLLVAIGWRPKRELRAQVFRYGVIAILATATLVRFANYDVVPDYKDNDDELFATWNGWSLLSEGRTRGWTLWPQRYAKTVDIDRTKYFRERPFFVVSPYVEHPPAMHILVGASAKVAGARHWLHARLKTVRLVPILLSLATLCLLFLVARRLSMDRGSTLFAGLWFATTPHMVLQQRVVKEEAMVAPVLLLVVWWMLRYRDDGRMRDLVAAALVAGLAIFIKVPAVAMVAVVAAMALASGGMRAFGIALAVGTLSGATLLLYALAVDWDVFWHVQGVQASVRKPHWNVFFRFFAEPQINHDRLGAGWHLLSWFATAFAVTVGTRRVQIALVIPLFVYMTAIAIPSGSWSYGWYALPLFPFLSLGIGIAFARAIRTVHPLWVSLFLFLGFYYTATFSLPDSTLADRHRWSEIRAAVTLCSALVLTPAFWNWLRPNPLVRIFSQTLFAGVMAAHVWLSVQISLNYEELVDGFANLDEESKRDRPISGPKL